MYLGERIKKLRMDSKMSQKDLADVLGIARSTLAGYEAGNIYPSMSVLLKISKHFNEPLINLADNLVEFQSTPEYDVYVELSNIVKRLSVRENVCFKNEKLTMNQTDFITYQIEDLIKSVDYIVHKLSKR